MSSPLYWFVMWILASVPVGLCLGCLCSLNRLSLDDDAADAGPMERRLQESSGAPRRRVRRFSAGHRHDTHLANSRMPEPS
jgi:hypothetical protein